MSTLAWHLCAQSAYGIEQSLSHLTNQQPSSPKCRPRHVTCRSQLINIIPTDPVTEAQRKQRQRDYQETDSGSQHNVSSLCNHELNGA